MLHKDELSAALTGMVTLAVAMGIGRFAFTPLLPMMQDDVGLSISAGGGLAAANYVGYFIGAVSALWLRFSPPAMIGLALAAVSVSTAAMGVVHAPLAWLALRAAAGIASAWALVFASAWTLRLLAVRDRRGLNGVLFGGVGLGIAVTGIACLVFLTPLHWSSDRAWLALGGLACLASVPAWYVYHHLFHRLEATVAQATGEQTNPSTTSSRAWLLVICYGAFGFGYIIPATFLPAMARHLVADPAVFGWAWPIFGAAALASTLAAGRLARRFSSRTLWIAGHLIMAAGVAVPIAWPGMTGIVVAALCVGGTFMVVAMTGLQLAREGAPRNPQRLMAAMTASFALGQILGPALVSLAGRDGLTGLSVAAAVVLVLSAAALGLRTSGTPARNDGLASSGENGPFPT